VKLAQLFLVKIAESKVCAYTKDATYADGQTGLDPKIQLQARDLPWFGDVQAILIRGDTKPGRLKELD
jgi:hypothetical protein